MKLLDVLSGVLVLVGAVNWGLVALARFDLVATVFGRRFGEVIPPSRVVYGLVGLAALYEALMLPSMRRRWQAA